jgi:fibronectin type 3 domain-containing protein
MTLENNFNAFASGYPVNIGIKQLDVNRMELSWTAPDSEFGVPSGYRIYRGFSKDEVLRPYGITLDTIFVDSGIDRGRDYFYRVTTIY